MTAAAPIEAVILGLDPAKHTSGAALLIPDYGNTLVGEDEHPFDGQYALVEFGKVETQSERERFVQSGLENAEELYLPLVVVAEEWDPPRTRKVRLPGNQFGIVVDPKWNYKTILGMGEGWGLWSAELQIANGVLAEEKKFPPFPVERVTPNEWRDDLWGPRRAKTSEAVNEQAQRYFEGVFGYPACADIATAGCIALWGTTSSRVAEAVQNWRAERQKRVGGSKNQQKAKRRRRAS